MKKACLDKILIVAERSRRRCGARLVLVFLLDGCLWITMFRLSRLWSSQCTSTYNASPQTEYCTAILGVC
ncbi:hypothetical protein PLICRDRAFT_41175 [Plicaturopsis crispa FD-325 SS-3]|nr:hypothetical protein PLICRDRAFT_41175 [Plicaturopsis crispa FD-325 SS-3]